MDRRNFLKLASAGAVIATSSGNAQARGNLEVPDEAVGMLFDATRCIGCRACVVACKDINGMPPEQSTPEEPWDLAMDLSADTLNIIKAYEPPQGDDGFEFIKRNCMHCVDAGCVSVCPVTAMKKDPKTGIVSHDPDACIGCRYCVAACPYNIPKYEYDEAMGQIQKCQLCNQKGVERIDNGELPGCAEVCPTGANIYGKRSDLLEEAKRRMALKPGDKYVYKLGSIDSPYGQEGEVPNYQDHIYGEKEGGGTQVLMLAGNRFEDLGMPDIPELSYAAVSETVQHSIYSNFLAPATVLGGLLYMARRNIKGSQDEEQDPNQDKSGEDRS
ncbi:hydrogenase 2 operon protein HybA [Motiliproteus coralliicola]|uniref:Hydrogenase 2 operon protein HybA n=1 Tax=Motiliproteus coralliicola TaxID=2283196 RepID=A0A369WEP8_9GAMM|nr:hydrogenase 2 operon protein HybA [Motiliproteus coralliicola]RDE19821.1 hydrogenase 2 operon protein HybA [Motiliproteus coralliicola]